jgi:hypothetical protein
MALSEIEHKRCEKELATFLAKRRPPLHIREQIDLSYRIDGHSVEIFEIRPKYQEPTQKHESPIPMLQVNVVAMHLDT